MKRISKYFLICIDPAIAAMDKSVDSVDSGDDMEYQFGSDIGEYGDNYSESNADETATDESYDETEETDDYSESDDDTDDDETDDTDDYSESDDDTDDDETDDTDDDETDYDETDDTDDDTDDDDETDDTDDYSESDDTDDDETDYDETDDTDDDADDYSESDDDEDSINDVDDEIYAHSPINDENMITRILQAKLFAYSTSDNRTMSLDYFDWATIAKLSEIGMDRIFMNGKEVFVSGFNKLSLKTDRNISMVSGMMKSRGLHDYANKIEKLRC